MAGLEGLEAYARGRHDNIYAVDLPAWLPVEILDKMVVQFRKHLHAALVAMMKRIPDPENCTHHHKISTEPASAWSIATGETMEHHPSLDSPVKEQSSEVSL